MRSSMPGRMAAAAALLAAMSGPAWADDDAQPFIESTYVLAPRTVGEYSLVDSNYDPKNRAAGVGLRYVSKEHPTVPFDVFVFPAGRQDETQAVSKGAESFRQSFFDAEKLGYYSGVRIDGESSWALPPSGPLAMAAPPGKDTTGAPEGDALPPGLDALLGADAPLQGRRIDLAYRSDNTPMRSRGYLFYKQLYYFKGRISAPESLLDGNAFAQVSDAAARELLPAIQALNVGACGRHTIRIDVNERDEEKRQAGLLRALGESLAGERRSNCVATLSPEELATRAKDAEVTRIVFEASDWKAP